MNKEQTIELAKQAGWTELGADLWGATHDGAMSTYALQRFAALVRADTALEAEPTPVQECGYDETTGSCTRNPCCAVAPAVEPVVGALQTQLLVPNWYCAQMLLYVWNPAVWRFYPVERRRRQLQLLYRARGIVWHDRALNGATEILT